MICHLKTFFFIVRSLKLVDDKISKVTDKIEICPFKKMFCRPSDP